MYQVVRKCTKYKAIQPWKTSTTIFLGLSVIDGICMNGLPSFPKVECF